MQYVPLWMDIIDGPCWKLLDLPPEVFRFYTLCLLAAQKFDFVEGYLPDDRTLAAWIHMDRDEAVTLRDMAVTCHVLERTDDGQYKIHDWEHWRDSKDPTAAARKRKERARKKALASNVTGESRNSHDGVTSMSSDVTPQHSTLNSQHTTLNSHTPLPPETGDEREQEPFESLSEEEPPPIDLPADKMIVFKFWGAKFSSSNGDRIVCDLLNLHEARVVNAACEFHYLDCNGSLDARKLAGVCRAMTAGRWKIPGDIKRGPSVFQSRAEPVPDYVALPADQSWKGPSFRKGQA